MKIPVRMLSLIALLAMPGILQAQHLPAGSFPHVPPAPLSVVAPSPFTSSLMRDAAAGRAATPTLVASAILAAGVSAAAAGAIGYQLEMGTDPMPLPGGDVGVTGLVTGWVIGPALVTPLVVHMVNDRQGSLAASYGAAALIAGVGLLTAHSDPPAAVAVALVIGSPALQAASAVLLERLTTRRPR